MFRNENFGLQQLSGYYCLISHRMVRKKRKVEEGRKGEKGEQTTRLAYEMICAHCSIVGRLQLDSSRCLPSDRWANIDN